jgi:tellurite resistance protein TehA-like permease
VLALYTHGHLALLGLINALLIKNEISSGTIFIPIIAIVYYGFACSQFYTTGKVRGVLKGMIAHVLSTLFFMIFLVIVLIAGLFVYIKFINPEFLDTL